MWMDDYGFECSESFRVSETGCETFSSVPRKLFVKGIRDGTMIYQARPGQTSSGEAIGILLLDTSVPFIPGDVANATTYDFPVRFQKVEGFSVARAIGKDPGIYDALLAAARDLVDQGVRAVTGDCGFMAFHQQHLAEDLVGSGVSLQPAADSVHSLHPRM
jgi:hypothetical protein